MNSAQANSDCCGSGASSRPAPLIDRRRLPTIISLAVHLGERRLLFVRGQVEDLQSKERWRCRRQ